MIVVFVIILTLLDNAYYSKFGNYVSTKYSLCMQWNISSFTGRILLTLVIVHNLLGRVVAASRVLLKSSKYDKGVWWGMCCSFCFHVVLLPHFVCLLFACLVPNIYRVSSLPIRRFSFRYSLPFTYNPLYQIKSNLYVG